MRTWIGSDFHWGHANIMKFCPTTRGHYTDITHMNEDMISMWNAKVSVDDLVYILGDVAFCSVSDTVKILNRLNGSKILIEGNHDRKMLKHHSFRNCFKEIHNYLETEYNGVKLVMFHFAIFDHNGAGRGSVMLHGHRHGNPTNLPGKIMDVGFDATGEIVVSMDSVLSKMAKIPHMYHHSPDRE